MKKLSCVCAFLIVLSVCQGADILYVCTSDGHVLGINAMLTGTYTRASAGDLIFADVYDSAMSWKKIASGNEKAASGTQVAVGAADAILRVYDGNLENTFYNSRVSSPENAITAVVIGDFGDLQGAVFAAHGYGGPTERGTNILCFNNAVSYMHYVGLSNTVTTGLALGNLNPAKAGNELIISSINDSTLQRSSSFLTGAFWNGSAMQVDFQHSPNNYVSGVAVGNILTAVGADDWIQYGGNPTGANPTYLGNNCQAFSLVGTTPTYQWYCVPSGAGTIVDGEIADMRTDNPGLEFVGAGNPYIYIIDAQTQATIQSINTGGACSCLTLADILGNDNSKEIVVGTPSGKILVYEHSTPGDGSTSFVLRSTLLLDPEGNGTEYQVTDVSCARNMNLVGDFNSDYKVNLLDMAYLSQSWLGNGFVPVSLNHPFNLEARSKLAINAMDGALSTSGYPYIMAYLYPPYDVEGTPGVLCGEYIDGLIMARLLSGTLAGQRAEKKVYAAMYSQLNDGFGDSAGGDWVELAGHKHYLQAFTTLLRLFPDDPAALDALQESLNKFYDIALTGQINGQPYIYFPVPTSVSNPGDWSAIMYCRTTGWPTPNMEPINTGSACFEGAIVLPFAQYYEIAGDPVADEFLDRFIRFILKRATDYNPDGSFTKTDVTNGQVWSRLMTNEGILIYGLAKNNTELINWARSVFDKALQLHGASFGWLPENLAFNHGRGCETDTMTAQIETAFLLARKVDDAYWEVAERIAMNQLLAQQLTTTHLPAETLPNRLRGGFASFCTPNDWDNPDGPYITQSSHGSGTRALYNVWYHTAWWEQGQEAGEAGRTLKVNLHWSKNLPDARIISHLPTSTQLDITVERPCYVVVRKPDWTPIGNIIADQRPVGGGAYSPVSITLNGRWMNLGHFDNDTEIRLRFPDTTVIKTDVINSQTYTTTWRGNAVLSISPDGTAHPNYRGRTNSLEPYSPTYMPRYAIDPVVMVPLENTEDLKNPD